MGVVEGSSVNIYREQWEKVAAASVVARTATPVSGHLLRAPPKCGARAAAAIPTYGKSTLVMMVVWHVKYKAASESIIGRSHQPTLFAMKASSKRR